MKKLISFILGSLFALNLSISAANAAANEVRVAYFLGKYDSNFRKI
jgi:taurine transport system substrate-binding protein